MNQPLVCIEQLTKRFGDFTALDSCDLGIHKGKVFGLLGPNGAGKSTMLRLILGFMKPTSGQATIQGLNCYLDRVAVHRLLAYLPGDARLPKTMRGDKVLKFFAGIAAGTSLSRSLEIAQRLELDLTRWVAFMSTGMRQKLALAITLASENPLLILDEPTANLDPTVRGEVLKLVAEARDAGRTVIFSSHVLSEIEEVCDDAGILRAGKLVHLQDMSDLMRQHRIRATMTGEIPPAPAEIPEHEFAVTKLGENEIQIETPGELSLILKWLANSQLSNVYIQPIGLRAVYDKYHGESESVIK